MKMLVIEPKNKQLILEQIHIKDLDLEEKSGNDVKPAFYIPPEMLVGANSSTSENVFRVVSNEEESEYLLGTLLIVENFTPLPILMGKRYFSCSEKSVVAKINIKEV